jgi:amino-acid N-acetyltransferase
MSEPADETRTGLRLVHLSHGERADARALLESCGLPITDLDATDVRLFRGSVDGQSVGVGGFELFGEHALLRSVAVGPEARGEGFGTAFCRALERRARDRGVKTLYLLTTDAAGFFERLGFDRCERESVPTAVRESREFTDLCPVSAVCMVKEIA